MPPHIIACLPLDELILGTTFLSNKFPDAKIMLHNTVFEHDDPHTQILLYIEENFAMNDNIYRLMICRNFQYLFFSKATNPNWRDTCGPGKIEEETEQFILWYVDG